MGRYLRKNKVAMEGAQSALGVRTRARTLAMAQQQQARKLQQEQEQVNLCYLELRSRKLEKPNCGDAADAASKRCKRPPKQTQQQQQPRRLSTSRQSIRLVSLVSRSSSISSLQLQQAPAPENASPRPQLRTVEIDEASCGDNAFDHDGHSSRNSFGAEHQRRFRESTPSRPEHQLIPGTPCSTTGARLRLTTTPTFSPLPAPPSLQAPTPDEIESFFASREEPLEEKRRLSDRYNFDFVSDLPLPGRFEWTTS